MLTACRRRRAPQRASDPADPEAVRRWYLIVAVAIAGCEQWKAPQRIGKLEDRVDELSSDVAELRGATGTPKARSKAGSGEAPHGEGSGEESAAKEPEHSAGSGEGPVAKVSEHGAKEPEAKEPEAKEPEAKEPAAKERAGRDDHAEPAPAKPAKDNEPEGDDRPKSKDDAKGKSRDDARGKDDGKGKDSDKPSDKGKDTDKLDKRALEQLSALAASGLAAKSQDAKPHWSYEGRTGPTRWGKLDPAWSLCVDGREQSPIDIEPHASKATPIAFHYKPTAATVIDNGHTLQVNLAAGSSIEIDGRVFDLLQFHFHTPSEHTIAGERYPLEVHLVHQGPTGKLAVIGVLYDVGAESRPLSGLWPPWPKKVGVADKLARPFDPTQLLPDTRTVYRYAGSLTTPPCSEGVLWNVMRRTPSDGRRHLEAFGEHFPPNARELQPRNDRSID
jgi:carbonic anhydrase